MRTTELNWQPYREPLSTTLTRTGTIAVVGGAVLAWRWGGLHRWPLASLLVLWPALGGHFVEVLFLNGLRPRISVSRSVQVAARLATWFLGGTVLALAMAYAAVALGGFRHTPWRAVRFGGVAFIGLEQVVHLALALRGRPNFYDGRG